MLERLDSGSTGLSGCWGCLVAGLLCYHNYPFLDLGEFLGANQNYLAGNRFVRITILYREATLHKKQKSRAGQFSPALLLIVEVYDFAEK